MKRVFVTVVIVTVADVTVARGVGGTVTGFGATDFPGIPLGGSVSTTFLEFPRD